MAVGDIERRQGLDRAGQRRDGLFVADHPELMAHAVIGSDVDDRRAGGGALEQGVDRRRRRIGEHHRAGLRVDRLDLAHAVVLLGRRRVLVLADAILRVSGDRGDRREAGFDVAAPGQPVDVVAGLVVANENAGGDHAAQIFRRLGIDRAGIGIGRGIEVDLGLGDVEKAPRLAGGALARLGAGQHVIGRRQNLGGASRRRPQRAKGLYQGQVESLQLHSCGILIRANPHYVNPVSTPDIILIAGPTASGKSALALALAEKLGGVVINADSMQVYRDLFIITARPTPEEERRAPHVLYGHIDAAEDYSVGRWCADAAAALAAAQRQSRAAVLVGGTGLYFNALTRGLAAVPPIPKEIRDTVRARLATDGVAALHAELQSRDPAAAARLMPGDRARVTRALEVVLATGRSLLAWHEAGNPARLDPARAAKIFLMPDRDELLRRIDTRFDAMIAAGAIAEVRALAARRLHPQSAGDEGARRALAHPPSQWRDRAGGGGRRRETRYPPIHQAAGDLVPQPASRLRLGRAARRACRHRGAVAVAGRMMPAAQNGSR